MKPQPRACLTAFAVTLVLAGLGLGVAAGADQPAGNPTGTWKMTIISTNAQARPTTQILKLKLNGDTLTGTLTYNSGPVVNGKAPISELPITEAKYQGNEIAFNFTHPPSTGNGAHPTYSYQGKVIGDSIKGTFTTEWMGHTRTRSWQAERMKQ